MAEVRTGTVEIVKVRRGIWGFFCPLCPARESGPDGNNIVPGKFGFMMERTSKAHAEEWAQTHFWDAHQISVTLT